MIKLGATNSSYKAKFSQVRVDKNLKMEITGQANRIFCRRKNVLKIYIFPAHHHHQAFFVPIIWDQLHGFYPSIELYKKAILLHILHLYNTALVADPDLSSNKLEWKR